jgi:penicillin amidase
LDHDVKHGSRAIILLIFTVGIFIGLETRFTPAPALGYFLCPFTGFWQNGEGRDKPSRLRTNGIRSEVEVVWDKRMVPHIFAESNYDLYFCQGYLTAADRLWQMEIQVMAAAGRLAEVLGPDMIGHDRHQRRIGIPNAAAATGEHMMSSPETAEALKAYTDGVNAYIRKLADKDLPLEYKLLDYRPEPWSPLKCALLLKQMAWDLTTYRMNELSLTRATAFLADDEFGELYPIYPPYTEPVIPAGQDWDFNPDLPAVPETEFVPSSLTDRAIDVRVSTLGSNSWALAPSRTDNSNPILCTDPHLSLTLPSIWYEVQLVSPDVNVYGVSLPGAPSVIIGFNERIAWGLTNAETDVVDWYAIDFADGDFSSYHHDGETMAIRTKIDTILVRDGEPIIDTVHYTHHGPIVNLPGDARANPAEPYGASLRWTGQERSNELMTFIKLNQAGSYDDYLTALPYYNSPGMNFVFACADGDIAVCHNGAFPVRWEGQGLTISDGSSSGYDWAGFIPFEHLPLILNPERGFVSSANQYPTGSEYPYFLAGTYAGFQRCNRINELIREHDDATVEEMMQLQLDVVNIQARSALPVLLDLLMIEGLDSTALQAYRELAGWDYAITADAISPMIYERWWGRLSTAIWQDDLDSPQGEINFPSREMTTRLILEDPESRYIDDRSTDVTESLSYIVDSSFVEAVSDLVNRYGEFGPDWAWGNTRRTDIMHLTGLAALSRTGLETGGAGETVNATTRRHGPSWRMVVEFGDPVRAWGIYPGGQSGNPGSRYYDHTVDDWLEGEYYQLHFLKSPSDRFDDYFSTTRIGGGE